jgi:2-dehydropantoate 2-reductase
MRICIVGCGAVGSLFAAHLATLPDVEVWAYDVAAEHVAAINAHGLRVTGHTELVARVRARRDPAEIPACDFGIVATKSMATAPAIAATAALFAEGAVCSVQNGLGNEELIAAQVARVMRGTTFPSGHLLAPGVVAMDTAGPTTIGPFEDRPASADQVQRLAEATTRAGLPTHARADARGAQWTKVIFNAACNPLGALTGLTQGRLCELAPARALLSGLVAEGVAVATALGITLDEDPEEVIAHSGRVAYEHRSSMLQDALAHRPTEIDAQTGAIARLGREHGVATPLHDAVAALVGGLERSWQSRAGEAP